jgi:transposase
VKEERTANINRIRGLLAEFGIIAPQSPNKLRERLAEIIEDADNDLCGIARMVIQEAFSHWDEIDKQLGWCTQRISAHVKENQQAQTAVQLMGVGPVTASAAVVTVGDFKQFKNGA